MNPAVIRHNSQPPITQRVWPHFLGMSISCLGLGLGSAGLAQSHPPIGTDTIDQILLPPATDVPEEILRTEIIFEARSPLDGTPMAPADYAQLQAELAAPQTTPSLTSDIRYIIFLLQARRAFKPVVPFLP